MRLETDSCEPSLWLPGQGKDLCTLSIVVLQGESLRVEPHKAVSVIAQRRAINGLPEIKRVLQLDQSWIVWALEDFVKRVAISRAKREE